MPSGAEVPGATPHRYGTYGLTILSELALPPLVRGQGPADVTIRVGAVPVPVGVDPARGTGPLVVNPDHVVFRTTGVGTASVRCGADIVVDPAPGVAPADLELWLLGRVLSMALHQRGVFVLHADTVDVDGTAVAFVGVSGTGKSTTAGAFVAAGCPLVAEDVTPVSPAGAALAGYPMLKLARDAAAFLGFDPGAGAATHPTKLKVCVDLPGPFDRAARALGAIYVVEDGDHLTTEAVSPSAAVAALLEHAYCAGFFDGAAAAALLGMVAPVARAVPVRRLVRPRRFDALTEVVARVRAEVRALTP